MFLTEPLTEDKMLWCERDWDWESGRTRLLTGKPERGGGGVVGSSVTFLDWRSGSSWLVSCLEGVWIVLRLSLVFENDEAALLADSRQKLS